MIDAKSGPYGVLLLRISLGILFLANRPGGFEEHHGYVYYVAHDRPR